MATRKLVTCIGKKDIFHPPFERIESIGGYYHGMPWKLTVEMAIKNIKKKTEEYFILSVSKKELNIIVATYKNMEYLKTETDNDSPDNLLGLPQFFENAIINHLPKR